MDATCILLTHIDWIKLRRCATTARSIHWYPSAVRVNSPWGLRARTTAPTAALLHFARARAPIIEQNKKITKREKATRSQCTRQARAIAIELLRLWLAQTVRTAAAANSSRSSSTKSSGSQQVLRVGISAGVYRCQACSLGGGDGACGFCCTRALACRSRELHKSRLLYTYTHPRPPCVCRVDVPRVCGAHNALQLISRAYLCAVLRRTCSRCSSSSSSSRIYWDLRYAEARARLQTFRT